MKMKSVYLPLILVAAFTHNIAQADLSAQLEAVAAAERQGAELEAKEQRARAKAQAAALAAKRAREKAIADAKKAEQERAYNEYMTDKKRDQSYEDELRQLEIEERKLELARKKARVNREDDFIDQELKNSAARTDVIQSEADATRNLSKGAENLMTKEGEARIKKESGFFK